MGSSILLEGKFWVGVFFLSYEEVVVQIFHLATAIWCFHPKAAKDDWYDITVRCLLGVLLPDTGLRDPEVSSSSADDQEDKS